MYQFRILYPERRVVSAEKILTWYQDAVANGEVDDLGAVSAIIAAQLLHEAGIITVEHYYPHHQRCQDCGDLGKMTGHQECQYPSDH